MVLEKYSIEDITRILKSKATIKGNSKSKYFNNVSSILDANARSLVWLDSRRKDKNELAKNTKAKIIITGKDVDVENLLSTKTFIIVDNPKLAFIEISGKLFSEKFRYEIHPTAFVSKEARIDKEVYIGPFTYVGKCTIKKGSIIHGNVFLYDNVTIGRNVIIHAGCVIGSDGYGYARNEKNEFEKFPHFGGVEIGNSVEVGANTCIDRGTLGNTIIKEGAKIDNLVHIAHNVIIGKHTAVIANSMIGGSTTIGDYSWIAPSASLMNKIKINDNVTVGMAAVVTKDIPDGETWTGSPARPLNEFLEILKKLKRI